MALYVDSAHLDDIARLCETFPIAGVTTNPTILLAAAERGQRLSDTDILTRLLEVVSGPVFMQPTATESEGLHAAASRYVTIAPQRVVLKLPPTEEGLRVGRALAAQDVRVAYTAACSTGQVYAVALAGAQWVIPYFGRLLRSGVDPCERIHMMARILTAQSLPTRLLVASLKSTSDLVEALASGAHDVTASPKVIASLLSDPLSDAAFAQFAKDWQALQAQTV